MGRHKEINVLSAELCTRQSRSFVKAPWNSRRNVNASESSDFHLRQFVNLDFSTVASRQSCIKLQMIYRETNMVDACNYGSENLLKRT